MWFSKVGETRKRRRQIISLMGRAVALQARAVDDGLFDRAHIETSQLPLSRVRERYDDLTAQALDLFEPGEEVVAFWTAVEFYAGWFSPGESLRARAIPRRLPESGGRLLGSGDMARTWTPARPQFLADWAQVRWPWDTRNARGPRFADRFTAGDTTRHHIVVPNSDSTVDMLRPFILYLPHKHGPFEKPSEQESKRLQEFHAQSNDGHRRLREMIAAEVKHRPRL